MINWRFLMNSFTRSVAAPVFMVLVIALISFGCGSSGGRGPVVPGPDPSGIQVAEPAVDRPSGYFVDPIDVTVSPGTAGTFGDTVELTTDGSVPSCGNGTAYLFTTVTISADTTIKAVACKDTYDDSDVLEASYVMLLENARVIPAVGETPITRAIRLAIPGDVIYVEPGTYTENNGQVTIDKRITLIGAGSGADPATNTIIADAPGTLNPIFISASGASATSRLAIRNLRVTGSTYTGVPSPPDYNGGGGIEIGNLALGGHIEFDNVASVGNSGNGIHFNVSGPVNTRDIIIRNSDLSFNGNHGFRVPSELDNIDGLVIDNTIFEGNTRAGIMFYDVGSVVAGSTNFFITNSTFVGNAAGKYQLGDIVFSGLNGNGTFSTVSIVGNASECGIRISGNKNGSVGKDIAGTLTLSNVNISGVQQSYGNYPSAGILISRYLGLSNVTMSNVTLGSTAPNGLFLGTITVGLSPDLGDLLLSDTYSVADIKLGSHGNSGGYDLTDIDIDATGVTFEGALTDQDIEDRIWHNVDEAALGVVSWTTP